MCVCNVNVVNVQCACACACLQALHDDPRQLANAEHTTLLVACYTKQRDTAALDALVSRLTAEAEEGGAPRQGYTGGAGGREGTREGGGEGGRASEGRAAARAEEEDPRVDANAVIRLCLEAGYARQALELAP